MPKPLAEPKSTKREVYVMSGWCGPGMGEDQHQNCVVDFYYYDDHIICKCDCHKASEEEKENK